jgi:hypothetical protein
MRATQLLLNSLGKWKRRRLIRGAFSSFLVAAVYTKKRFYKKEKLGKAS